MRIFDRSFNKAESMLLLVLALILVVLLYFKAIYIPAGEAIERAHAERAALETELLGVQMRVGQLTKMREELDKIGGNADRMESYNNAKAELSLLNNALSNAREYSIAFEDVTRDGDQIRRNFSLEFTADSFDAAKAILMRLTASEYRCLIGDVEYTQSRDGAAVGSVELSATATFYETMVGGKPDAGLPQDTGAQAS